MGTNETTTRIHDAIVDAIMCGDMENAEVEKLANNALRVTVGGTAYNVCVSPSPEEIDEKPPARKSLRVMRYRNLPERIMCGGAMDVIVDFHTKGDPDIMGLRLSGRMGTYRCHLGGPKCRPLGTGGCVKVTRATRRDCQRLDQAAVKAGGYCTFEIA